MKTDLKKIMSVSGHPGLFRLLTQSRGGVIVESMTDGKRTWMGPSARMTTLSDIYIYTEGDEMPLGEVLEKMKAFLAGADAPTDKSPAGDLQQFFKAVIPDYDVRRFYTSHMKKVVAWYKVLKDNDALEFEEPLPGGEAPAEDGPQPGEKPLTEEKPQPGNPADNKPDKE